MDRLGKTGEIDLRSLRLFVAVLFVLSVSVAAEANPAADQRNIVKLQSQPGVEILWENVSLGETDAEGTLVIEGIPSGEYRLTLRKHGFHQLDLQMRVEEGTSSSRAHFLEAVKPRSAAQANSKEVAPQQAEPQQTLPQQSIPPRAKAQKATAESLVADHETTVALPAKRPNGDISSSTAPSKSDSRSTTPTTKAPAESVARPALGEESAATAGAPEPKSGLPFSPFLGALALLLALLAGAAGARFLQRSRHGDTLSHAPLRRGASPPAAGDGIPLFEEVLAGPTSPTSERDAPGFLEDLKQRERDFGDGLDTATRRREETIIEVEAVEVVAAPGRSGDKTS